MQNSVLAENTMRRLQLLADQGKINKIGWVNAILSADSLMLRVEYTELF